MASVYPSKSALLGISAGSLTTIGVLGVVKLMVYGAHHCMVTASLAVCGGALAVATKRMLLQRPHAAAARQQHTCDDHEVSKSGKARLSPREDEVLLNGNGVYSNCLCDNTDSTGHLSQGHVLICSEQAAHSSIHRQVQHSHNLVQPNGYCKPGSFGQGTSHYPWVISQYGSSRQSCDDGHATAGSKGDGPPVVYARDGQHSVHKQCSTQHADLLPSHSLVLQSDPLLRSAGVGVVAVVLLGVMHGLTLGISVSKLGPAWRQVLPTCFIQGKSSQPNPHRMVCDHVPQWCVIMCQSNGAQGQHSVCQMLYVLSLQGWPMHVETLHCWLSGQVMKLLCVLHMCSRFLLI